MTPPYLLEREWLLTYRAAITGIYSRADLSFRAEDSIDPDFVDLADRLASSAATRMHGLPLASEPANDNGVPSRLVLLGTPERFDGPYADREVDAALEVFAHDGPDECMPLEEAGQILASAVVALREEVASADAASERDIQALASVRDERDSNVAYAATLFAELEHERNAIARVDALLTLLEQDGVVGISAAGQIRQTLRGES